MTVLSKNLQAVVGQYRGTDRVAHAAFKAFCQHETRPADEARTLAANELDDALEAYSKARRNRRELEARLVSFDKDFEIAQENLRKAVWELDEACIEGDDDKIAVAGAQVAVTMAAMDELFAGARGRQQESDQANRAGTQQAFEDALKAKDEAKRKLDDADAALAAAKQRYSELSTEFSATDDVAKADFLKVVHAAFDAYAPAELKALRAAAQAKEDSLVANYYPVARPFRATRD